MTKGIALVILGILLMATLQYVDNEKAGWLIAAAVGTAIGYGASLVIDSLFGMDK